MKRILFLSISLCILIPATAQILSDDYIRKFEINQQLDSILDYNLSSSTSIWDTNHTVYEYLNEGFNRYKGDHGWLNDSSQLSSKYYFNYDANENLTNHEYYSWTNGSWEEKWRNKYVLSYVNGKITEKLEQRFQNNEFVNKYRTSYNYNNGGKLEEEVYQSVVLNTSDEWSNAFGSKINYTYINEVYDDITYYKGSGSANAAGGDWTPSTYKKYTYNNIGTPISNYNHIYTFSWIAATSSWDSTLYQISYYDGANQVTSQTLVSDEYYMCPEEDVPGQVNCVPSERYLYSYNFFIGQLTQREMSRWNEQNKQYERVSRLNFTYDLATGLGAKMIKREYSEFINGDWELQQIKAYYYKEGTTAIQENEAEIVIQVAPNPVQNSNPVELTGFSLGKLSVYNLRGELLKEMPTQSGEKIKLNLADFNKGTYLMNYKGADGASVSRKLVVL